MAKKKDPSGVGMMEGTFKEAFAAARKAGKKTFRWNGKTYHTKTKEEVAREKGTPPIGDPSLSIEHKRKQAEALEAMLKKKKMGGTKMMYKGGGFLEPGIESLD